MKSALTLLTALLLAPLAVFALDYPYTTAEPQKSGWPLTEEEKQYVLKPEHDRRPGRESNKHLPQLWPVVPCAGHFGGDVWLKLHEAHVKMVQENRGPIDVLLVGDSITIQWGESWKKHFPELKAVNIGIGGDKTQNVLWRLDHGGVEGLQPKAIVLMIGNNNMFFTPETGIEAAAKGVEMCAKNLRDRFPDAAIIVVKILPAHAPGNRFYEDIKKTNSAIDALSLDSDPKLRVLDMTPDFTNADGTLKKDLFTPDNIHLLPAGYATYAERLKPLLRRLAAAPPTQSKDYALEFSTYLGGALSWDQARDVCVDREGNVIVVGGTASADFPVTTGAYDVSFHGGGTRIGSAGLCDVFVAKFSPSGRLRWATYLGGPNYDRAYAVATDAQGDIIVAGRAGPGFPVSAGAAQKEFQGVHAGPYGQQNAFVAKLSADGTRLMWSTYLGVGAMVRDFELDSAGNVVAAFGSDPGSGTPPAAWFSRAYQPARRGGIESGVAKLAADGAQVLWATWFGGSGDESSEVGVSVDAQDRVYITGNTKSTDLPIIGAESDRTQHGGWDGYLAVFSPDGSRLLCSTYLGGSDDDFVLNTHALAVDAQRNAYIHCATSSTDFPTSPGAWSRTHRGKVDGALVKIDTVTGRLLLGTYLDGAGFDNFDGIGLDAAGNVFLAGETDSADFPVTAGAFQRVKGGGVDAVLLLLRADFSGLLYSTFIGGPADDRFRSGCLGRDGSLYGVGTSSGDGFPVRHTEQPAFAGGGGVGDAMVVKFSPRTAERKATP